MKDEYYNYIKLFLLSRDDYYYINGFYSDARGLYSRVVMIAGKYEGTRTAIINAIAAIERRIKITEEKEISQPVNSGNFIKYYIRYLLITIRGFFNALTGKTYFTY